ncbi:hypothetical protein [Arcobacter aquimarinus]|uniref:hypothetical protein n=1 Tax=Arcobacter aquimarinus TaxID=1315211 RepID=UPI003BB07A0E
MNPIKIFFDKYKIYFYLAFILAVVYFYVQNTMLETKLQDTNVELNEANNNNKLMYEAYEKTLAIEREIANKKLQTQEQKEKVAVKYKALEKEIEKRGEIKQDENSNFTIVSF